MTHGADASRTAVWGSQGLVAEIQQVEGRPLSVSTEVADGVANACASALAGTVVGSVSLGLLHHAAGPVVVVR